MKKNNQPKWFILRREPYYHKIQYSKTPKFDIAAAVFGVVIGAFGVYLTLSSVGSAGSDLSDLTALIWYSFLLLQILRLFFFLQKKNTSKGFGYASIFVLFFKEILSSTLRFFKKHKN